MPTYSFEGDTTVGMWRSGTDRLNFLAGGREFIELNEGSNDELRINDTGRDINFRVESDDEANMFFVDGGANIVGIGTNNPQTGLHIAGSTNIVRIESLNSTNNVNNNGVVPSSVMVDTNRDLVLTDSDLIDSVTLATDYSFKAIGFSDVPGMSLTFVARKTSVLVMISGSGDTNTQLAEGIADFQVINNTSETTFGGTHEKLTTWDLAAGVLSAAWSISFTKPLTGFTVGNSYTLKLQALFDPILTYVGTPSELQIFSASTPSDHHLTLSVMQ